MKVLIVSDTHRQDANLCRVLENVKELDLMIHLGDAEGSEDFFEAIADCPVEIISGNNDFFSRLPREKIINLGKYKVWLTHGHYYNVSFTYEKIIKEAEYKNADIVMFGHIHRPVLEKHNNIMLVNPGSLSYPRQADKRPSYIIMQIDDDGEACFTINYI